MKQRHLAILFVVSLVVLLAAIWVSHRAQQSGASVAGTPVLPGLEAHLNALTEVRIRGADGRHVTLLKGARHWQVKQRDYPADSGKLRKLLIDLGNLKAVARKTRLPAQYAALGVQSPSVAGASGVRIDLVSPGRTWSLIVGHSDGGSGAYVRPVGRRQSLLAAPLVMAEAKPSQWLSPIIIDLKHQQVRSVEERLAHEPPYRIARSAPTVAQFRVLGIPPGRTLSGPGAADALANALSNLTLNDVRKATSPPPGVAFSSAVFTTFAGLRVTVRGFPAVQKGPHYIELTVRALGTKAAAAAARLSARVRGWEYRIPDYRYQQIFQPLSELLQPLAGPAGSVRKPSA
ncbi:MAG: DUF4340 domain-containing protein [Steroidobacteraceae bacterium]